MNCLVENKKIISYTILSDMCFIVEYKKKGYIIDVSLILLYHVLNKLLRI